MSNAVDVCLVSPSTRAGSLAVPAALLYLDAWLKHAGFNSRVVDIKLDREQALTGAQLMEVSDKTVRTVAELAPRFVGLPCCTAEFSHVVELAGRLRRKVGCKVVVGGVHPTLYPEDFFFEGSPIDFAVVGDGQEPLCAILSDDGSPNSPHSKGAVCVDFDSALTAKKSPASFRRWEEMPTPDYSQLDMDHYTRPQRNIVRNLPLSGVHIFTTLGCPFRCTFCANRKHKVTYRPIPLVLDELGMLHDKFGIDSFYIQDDTFLIIRKRVFEFVEGMRQRKLDLLWALETRVNLFDEEIAALLAGSGCLQVDFGVESGSLDALRRMKKGITPEETVRAFEICRRHGLRTFATFMFNTPGETDEDVEKTIELMRKIRATRTGVGLTIPFPGTSIYDTYVRPPVTKDSYMLFGGDAVNVMVADHRFRMATHSRNLEALRSATSARFNGLRMLVDYTFQPAYWKTALTSRRRLEYLKSWTSGTYGNVRVRILRYAKLALRRGASIAGLA